LYYSRNVRKFVLKGRTALHYAAGVGGAAGLYQHMLEQGALDNIKDQVCFISDLDGPEGALDNIKDQVCLVLTLVDQREPWTLSRNRFV
jgi:hypothetical protein